MLDSRSCFLASLVVTYGWRIWKIVIWLVLLSDFYLECSDDTRKYSFSNRIIPLWNSLPEKVVSSSTVKSFKVRLDRFWANEEIYYNYKTNISCTGSRSNYDSITHSSSPARSRGKAQGLGGGLGAQPQEAVGTVYNIMPLAVNLVSDSLYITCLYLVYFVTKHPLWRDIREVSFKSGG